MLRRSRLSRSKEKRLLIRPRLAFSNVGGTLGVSLNPNRVYSASVATNQPDYKEKGLVFVNVSQKAGTDEFLLGKKDYVVIKK